MYTMWYMMIFKIVCCYCSVAVSCLTLCNLMDCSTPGPLSSTISQSLLEFMSIESVMISNHLIFCHSLSFCLQSFLALGPFPINLLFTSDGQSIRASASASVLLTNIQGWFNLGLTGLISVLTKGLSKVFSSTTI